MNNAPLVSIVIRTKNEGKSLTTLLPLLFSQKTSFPFEIILLNNESTDQTEKIIQNYPLLKVFNIPDGQYHPSKSLNDAAPLAQGKILVHLSAHCFPTSFYWLQNLAQPLLNNPAIIASSGRQFTDPNVNAYEEIDYSQLLFPKFGEPKIKTLSSANGAIKKSYLLEHPFNENISALEDYLWFLEMQGEGQVVYVPKAEILHLHPLFNLRYYLSRWQKEGLAVFYINKVKNLTSPLTDLQQSKDLLSLKRLFSFAGTALSLIRRGLILYGLFAPIFFVLRDYSWRKGLIEGEKRFTPHDSS